MSEYFDKRIENIGLVINLIGRPQMCVEIQTNRKDQIGNPVTIFLTKAELRKALEQIEAL